MSYQELQVKIGELRNLAQGSDDATTVRSLRVDVMALHSDLPLESPYIELIEQVLRVTKDGPFPQRLSRARLVLSWLQNDLTEAVSYLAEKQVSREENGDIVYA